MNENKTTDNILHVEIGVPALVENAMQKCFTGGGPIIPLSNLTSDKYIYIYRSAANPCRFAAIERKRVPEDGRVPTDLQWLRKNGVLLKTGKVVALLLPMLTSHEVEVLSGYVADELRGDTATSEGVEFHAYPSYIYTIRSLSPKDVATSCMRDKDAVRFQIYDDIGNCGIVYMTERGNLIGRALVWENVEVHDNPLNPKRIKIMDRVFCRDCDVLAKILKWGKENGYFVKAYPDRANCKEYICPETGTIRVFNRLSVLTGFPLSDNSYVEIPYFDTFCYAKEHEDRLYSWDKDSSCSVLQDTDGRGGFLTSNQRYTCYRCERTFELDDLTDGPNHELYCERCYRDRFFECERCGEVYSRDYECEVDGDIVCSDCLDDGPYFRCDQCNEYHHESYFHTINPGLASDEEVLCDACYDDRKEDEEIVECPHCYGWWHPSLLEETVANSLQLDLFTGKTTMQLTGEFACPHCAHDIRKKAEQMIEEVA